MRLTFGSIDNPLLLELEYPAAFSCEGYLEERNTEGINGEIDVNEIWFDGVCLTGCRFKPEQKSWWLAQCTQVCWLMLFVLEGSLALSPEGKPDIILKNDRYYTFSDCPLDLKFYMKQPVQVFWVCLANNYLKKLPDKGQILLELVADSGPVTSRSREIIHAILNAGQQASARRIFLEAKVLELLSLQLGRLEAEQRVTDADDVEKLYLAKSIIEQNIQSPCSLIELARKSGLNDFKLKKGFKSVFGNTVFGYLFELRMEKAYALLQQGKTVGEVAEAVGYKNQHHFTAAFKKKFNMLPSKVGR
ncbi:helix-turn-helix transcriptional regulator [Pedobacter sp. BS3]|uniref:helix-turn-helix transcriptional regulator n=1 Tax=Pedobacter sp. BS3 TaxID=2567937 RepID=UPI001659FB4A|nr:AraC family transcriptional regulator [Pedobacter sp. BS3]